MANLFGLNVGKFTNFEHLLDRQTAVFNLSIYASHMNIHKIPQITSVVQRMANSEYHSRLKRLKAENVQICTSTLF